MKDTFDALPSINLSQKSSRQRRLNSSIENVTLIIFNPVLPQKRQQLRFEISPLVMLRLVVDVLKGSIAARQHHESHVIAGSG